ncbi:hypothetical protein PAPYR_1556 [Paratrimastix pyriformis]|uniref:Uncharacterized protein n=1 Tax=Paratrimastix pyriformis TaxID=342808 RepID=A0ABQ8UTM0_9EUKA|nr:hypothetical protein PAPYR_1556 [Paratrimastix pyriformis]
MVFPRTHTVEGTAPPKGPSAPQATGGVHHPAAPPNPLQTTISTTGFTQPTPPGKAREPAHKADGRPPLAIRVRVSCCTGSLLCGPLGTSACFSVLGAPVTLASQLINETPPDCLHFDRATFDQLPIWLARLFEPHPHAAPPAPLRSLTEIGSPVSPSQSVSTATSVFATPTVSPVPSPVPPLHTHHQQPTVSPVPSPVPPLHVHQPPPSAIAGTTGRRRAKWAGA